MKLSLCLAVFNEEKFIQYPLDSAYDLADEVIIVDGGSDDNTIEVAKKYGKKVRVIQTTNPPMFHINKQKALDAAKGEWILQLDADEALSEELKKEIVKLLNGQIAKDKDEQPVAYYLPRKNFFLSRFLEKGGLYPDYTIRLYKRGAAKFPCKSVHENVEIASSRHSGEERSDDSRIDPGQARMTSNIGYLKNPLLHYADPDFSRYLHRWNRYTSLDAALIVKKKEHLNFFEYFFIKPLIWFLKTYIRHKGFQDGFPGFVFSLFSSVRFWVIYIKVWQLDRETKTLKSLS